MSKPIQVILAHNHQGIGYQGTIPWKIQHDLSLFRHLTTHRGQHSAIIMGKDTYKSMGYRPLSNRVNIILSTTLQQDLPDVFIYASLEEALEHCDRDILITEIWVIGGKRLYQEAFVHPRTSALYITQVLHPRYDCDVYVTLPSSYEWKGIVSSPTYEERGIRYQCTRWTKGDEKDDDTASAFLSLVDSLRYDEFEYLNLVHRILKEEKRIRPDRTMVGTHSLFGYQCRYNLNKSFPLFTTKRTFWKGIVQELLWMVSGSTDSKILENQGVTIWKGNASRNFLDKNGFQDREVGDLGPIYGFQWRHFGAKYTTSGGEYKGQGVDQLKHIIHQIKTNPTSRRIVLSAWNVSDLSSMALPPCHILCQFYVDTTQQSLSCHLYQRSCDLGLGVPFNVASYALLTHMIAHVTNLQVSEFIHSMGDAHIYQTHVKALTVQMGRSVRKGPRLQIVDGRDITTLDEFRPEHFVLEGYHPHCPLRMEMAV